MASNYGQNVWSSYAGGDYYQGDYYSYQAGSIFGKLLGGVVGAVKGFVKGGPLGAVGGAISGVTGRGSSSTAMVGPMGPPPVLRITGQTPRPDVPKGTPGAVPQPGPRGAIERFLPGGQSGYVPGSAVGAGAPAGYHWNKSFSYARGLPAGSFLVRNRSMNPANARALRRSVRRQHQFIAVARRVLKGTGMTIKRSGVGGARRRARR